MNCCAACEVPCLGGLTLPMLRSLPWAWAERSDPSAAASSMRPAGNRRRNLDRAMANPPGDALYWVTLVGAAVVDLAACAVAIYPTTSAAWHGVGDRR